MPRIDSTSSFACAGHASTAARSSAALNEPARRLPAIPTIRIADGSEPADHRLDDRRLAPAIEMIAVLHDVNRARTGGALREGLGGIELARLAVTAQVEHRTADAGRSLEQVRAVLQRIDEARSARHVPPA